ncbi:hypothetical protein MMA231_00504 [Asticcacaulis sp. MM231]|uniref:LytTR family DNA-binding domain-containing protein n=1 Tax=Asticcacaulis sp. MM231 TaxID=3157666 RepID=UPI0032D580A0
MRWKDHWPWALSLVIYVSTVVCAALAMVALRHDAGRDIDVLTALSWQGLIYTAWWPFVWAAWTLVRRIGLTARLILWFYPLILAYTLIHAFFAVQVDASFSHNAPHLANGLNLLPVDLLIATAIAALVAAVRGARLSAEARAVADLLQEALDQARKTEALPQRLPVSVGNRTLQVDPAEVEWCAAAGNYVVINFTGADGQIREGQIREGLIRETLTALSERLDPAVFARAHRSTVVNLARVRATQTLPDGGWVLTMESGADVVVSRTYRDAILSRLSHPRPR